MNSHEYFCQFSFIKLHCTSVQGMSVLLLFNNIGTVCFKIFVLCCANDRYILPDIFCLDM